MGEHQLKTMTYILKNIKNFAKNNTVIFVLFLLCQMAASLTILISYGAFENFKLVKSNNISNDCLSIGFGKCIDKFKSDTGDTFSYECDGSTDNKKIKKLINSLDKSTLDEMEYIYYTVDSDGMKLDKNMKKLFEDNCSDLIFRISTSQDGKKFIPYSVADENSPMMFGRNITKEEYSKGAKLVTLPCSFTEDYIGEKVQIGGTEYTVCGIDACYNEAVISFVNSPDLLNGITNIEFDAKTTMTKKSYDKIKKACYDCFGSYAFVPKINTINDNLPYYNSIIILAVMLTFVSAITLMLLYRYVLMTRNKMISVMRICGMSSSKARRMFISEVMITSFICFGIVSIFYFKVIVNNLRESYEYIDKVYSVRNYILTSAIYLLVTYLSLNTMIIFRLKRSPVVQMSQEVQND